MAYSENLFARFLTILETDSSIQALEKFRDGTGSVLTEDQADLVGQLIGFDFKSSPAVQRLIGDSSFSQVAYLYLRSYFRNLAKSPYCCFLKTCIGWTIARLT
jgi:hypothetical protein